MKTVTVCFENSSKGYDYFVDDSVEVEIGDYAVAHNGEDLRIVNVRNVRNGIVSTSAHKTLVTIINAGTIATYRATNEDIKNRRLLLDRLEHLLKVESENNKYRLLAASNTEAADILAKLGIS